MLKATDSQYRGSSKHKRRPATGRKGTLCPEWTHGTATGALKSDVFRHDWPSTRAHGLFSESEYDPEGGDKRYATAKGIAFAAQPTEDGSWHGYPEPWNKIPATLKEKWRAEGKVSGRELRLYSDFPRENITWALDTDDD